MESRLPRWGEAAIVVTVGAALVAKEAYRRRKEENKLQNEERQYRLRLSIAARDFEEKIRRFVQTQVFSIANDFPEYHMN